MKRWVTVAAVLLCFDSCTAETKAQDLDLLPTMRIQASVAPNVFGSPSWTSYLARALFSLENNTGNDGNRLTDPTAYEIATATVDAIDLIVSGFPSWRAQANPSSPFNGEFGNRLHFGLVLDGNGQQFRLSNLSFVFDSTDSGNALDFVGNFLASGYAPHRVGIDYVDGIEGNGNDVVYTSGLATQPVNKLLYVGVGNALDATFELGADNQAKIDSALAYIYGQLPFSAGITYELRDDSGALLTTSSALLDVITATTVPEPHSLATWSVAGIVIGGLGWRKRR